MKKYTTPLVIELPCYGIVVVKTSPNSGSIKSDLHIEGEKSDRQIDVVEALILAHSCAGVDVTTPEYIEGIETIVEAIGNHY